MQSPFVEPVASATQVSPAPQLPVEPTVQLTPVVTGQSLLAAQPSKRQTVVS